MSIASIACFLALMIVQLGAQTCNDLPEDILRQAHVDAIKRAILFKLQFLEEPENPSGPIVVPQSVLDEYQAVSAALALVSQRQVGCMEQPDFPPKFVVLHPQDILRRSGYHGVHGDYPLSSQHAIDSPTHLLRFDLDLTDKDIISSAELRLWYHIFNKNTLKPHDIQRISIFHIIKQEGNLYYGEDPTHYCTRAEFFLKEDGYVGFNITSALQQWLDVFGEAHGRFYIEVTVEKLETVNDDGEVIDDQPGVEVVYTDTEGRYSRTTQLVLKTYSSGDRRRRQVGGRVDPTCTETQSINCCKRKLVLDIHRDLKWTWVIRPRTLSANYCSGLCSVNWPVATYHTLLNLIHRTNTENPTGSPAPCCVPDKFVPVPFLIFNRTTIELISIEDISIESCICR